MTVSVKNITLFSTKASGLKDRLTSAGFSVRDMPLPTAEEMTTQGESHSWTGDDLCILEALPASWKVSEQMIRVLRGFPVPLILFLHDMTPEIRKVLLQMGIADVFLAGRETALIRHLKSCHKNPATVKGRLLIHDDNEAHLTILNTLLRRFHYEPVLCRNQEELFDRASDSMIQFTLINLSNQGFDVNSLVRKSYADSRFRSIPLLVYKNQDDGLFIHELISGLNRLTKVILNTEELYTLLIHLFFRKEFYPWTDKVHSFLNITGLRDFLQHTPSQIFHTMGAGLFQLDNLFEEGPYRDIEEMVEKMREILIKAESLRWLVMSNKPAISCGGGA